MHLDEEQLQRLLHRELGSREAAARDHLETCAECRYRMAEAEREESWVFERLHQLDHATPNVSVQAMSRSHGGLPPWRRVAAGIILALAAAGVAYAAPGSPLPRVLSRIVESVNGASRRRTPVPAIPSPGMEAQAGIVVGAGERLTIMFPPAGTGGEANVSLTNGVDVVVRALDGAAFTSGFNRLLINSVGPRGRFEVEIPRSAPLVEILVGGKRVFLKERSRIVTDAPPDGNGSYRLLLSGREP